MRPDRETRLPVGVNGPTATTTDAEPPADQRGTPGTCPDARR